MTETCESRRGTVPALASSRAQSAGACKEAASGKGLGQLVLSTGIYSAAGMVQQAIGFFLLPVYMTHLRPSEYGLLEVVNAFSAICVITVSLGLPSALVKCYHSDCRSESEKRSILPTALAFVIPVVLASCVAMHEYSNWLSACLLKDVRFARLINIAAWYVLASSVSGMFLAFFRARQEALKYAVLTVSQFLILVALNLYFVVALRLGVVGILWGNLLAAAALCFGAMPMLRGTSSIAVRRGVVSPLLSFGMYTMPAALAGWAVVMADRYILLSLMSPEAVGIYSVGYKLGRIAFVMLVWPFQLAWPAFAFSISQQSGHKAVYAQTLTFVAALLAFSWVGLSLFSSPLLALIGRNDYQGASSVVPFVALGYVFYGVHYCVSPGIHLAGKTRYVAPLVMATAALNVVLNLLLIPTFGVLGAAGATATSLAGLGIATGVVSARVYPSRYDYPSLIKITLAALSCYLIGACWRNYTLPVSLGAAAIATLAFPVALRSLGVVRIGYLALFRQAARQISGCI